MSEISIVTAFFDIGRKNWKGFERDNSTYANYFKFWARVKNHLIVYTEPKMAEQVKKIRADYGLLDKTTVIVIEDVRKLDEPIYNLICDVLSNRLTVKFRRHPWMPECCNPLYNYIMYMKTYFLNDAINNGLTKNNMVACYAIGWRFTPQEAKQYPYIRPAQSADDLGTVIMFNSEAPEVTSSLMVPHGEKSFCINPLNWRTDGTMADKALNSGACFTDYSGSIKREVPQLTGCCIDTERGVLKVTDIDKKQYPPVLSIFTDGIYHLYDYQFFYRNLQQNVGLRINTFVEERQVQNAA